MGRIMMTGAVLLALAACGDPDTNDRRGYTKAPLETPAVLVDGEEPGPVAGMGRTNRPRPRLDLAEAVSASGDDAAGEQEVTLAAGVTQEQFDQGQELFTGQGGCQACHGPNAQGTQLGPDLTDAEWLHVAGPDLGALTEVITNGVPQPVEAPAPMPPMGGAALDAQQVEALAAYIASISQG
ncbi:MAG TPA: c-type cytochrome [Longimicrobiales bacterium]|nr:c-type cytochrome [Longimicrobiales bacterium]